MTISRFVVLLTPLFAALAGWACDAVAQYLPGHPALDRGELTVLFVTGATAATAAAVKWLHGRSLAERQAQQQEWSRRMADEARTRNVEPAPALVPAPAPRRSRAKQVKQVPKPES